LAAISIELFAWVEAVQGGLSIIISAQILGAISLAYVLSQILLTFLRILFAILRILFAV